MRPSNRTGLPAGSMRRMSPAAVSAWRALYTACRETWPTRSRTPEASASTPRWSPSRTVSSSATRAAVTLRPASRSSSGVVGVRDAVMAPTYPDKRKRFKTANDASLYRGRDRLGADSGGGMAEYHFVSIWQIQAPIERVWDEIYHAERWPSWWKYVVGVDLLEPGGADGVGKRQRFLFRTRMPYTLGFEGCLTYVQPPSKIDVVATGELEGTGRWTLTSADGGTLVRYNWDVRPTKRWMNLLAPVARPAFSWNHDEL